MTIRALGLVMLLLAPATGALLAGFVEPARYLALGALLALQLSLLARPVATFSILLPMVYAASAVTAHATGGVIALIVAVAAAVGAASSLGYQRGLLAVLAAALIGSSEAALPSDVLSRAAAMLAGGSCAYLLAVTVLRDVHIEASAVKPQTALSYAVLLAVLVMAAWFIARYAGLSHPWWLPLAVAAVGEPAVDRLPRRSMARLLAALAGTVALVVLVAGVESPALRAALVVVLAFVMLVGVRRWRWFPAVLVTPLLLLVASRDIGHASVTEGLGALLLASLLVFCLAALGQWVLWALRADSGRLAV
jgi:hypothetical protein